MKLGFISDIHEDTLSLKKAIKILKSRKCDQIICLGDLVGYSVPYFSFLESRQASQVIETIRKNCDIVVVGNHDLFVAEKIPRHKAGFKYLPNWYQLDYTKRKKSAKNKIFLYESTELPSLLDNYQIKYLRKLPEFVVKKFGSVNILLSHYAYPDLTGSNISSINTNKDLERHFKLMKKFDCQLSFCGHEHQEGAKIAFSDTIFSNKFGKIKIESHEPVWISGPCVANGSFENGVMIFDTNNFILELIPLKSKILKKM